MSTSSGSSESGDGLQLGLQFREDESARGQTPARGVEGRT